jgi:hypothetical protein
LKPPNNKANDEAEEKRNLKKAEARGKRGDEGCQKGYKEILRRARQALWQRARLEGVFNLHSRIILWLLH